MSVFIFSALFSFIHIEIFNDDIWTVPEILLMLKVFKGILNQVCPRRDYTLLG